MFFSFPDHDTLRLALTSGAVPPEVSRTPVTAAFEGGHVWAQPSVPMSSPGQIALRRLGVKIFSRPPDVSLSDYSCWAQLLPLEREPANEATAAQTLVLFELADPRAFTDLVGEILRLGNDRQAFRWIQGPDDDPRERVLLRVIGPPYYSMLRVLDCDGRREELAYVERSPGVWVEVGYRHALQDMLRPPEGKVLLLRPPRDWHAVDDRPFQDIYEVLEFPAPDGLAWQDSGRREHLEVPLRLARASTNDPAEMWVVRDRPVEQLDNLVRELDDQLLGQLAFAAGELQGQELLVLRVRPGRKTPPPVLSLAAEEYRSYLRLPNLFLPVRTRLRPPLRRDAVRQHLAEDPERIHWLAPGADGSFTAESLPDRAFRPLSDWILYVLDHERRALTAWIQSATFEFDAFLCREQKPPKEKKERKKKDERTSKGAESVGVVRGGAPAEEKKPAAPVQPELGLQKLPPSALQLKARDLEKQFLEIQGPPDAAGRKELWHELAGVYAALGHNADAVLCGVNAQWQETDTAKSFAGWSAGSPSGWLDAHLEGLLNDPKPAQGQVHRLAACLLALGHGVGASLSARIGPVQHFLQQHESRLPVRAVWLLGLTLARAAGGDVLALARIRDRLLERLYQSGLSIELDVAGFMRFSASQSSDRMRRFRDWLLTLPERLHDWVIARSNVARPSQPPVYPTDPRLTAAYADLMMAFGLARLGDAHESQRLQERACEVLGNLDNVHSFLLSAFDYRVHQALDGKGVGGPLPADFFDLLPAAEGRGNVESDERRLNQLKVDRLRQKSRILEPHEALNAYDRFLAHHKDPLGKALVFLSDVTDKQELERQVRLILKQAVPKRKKDNSERPRVLRTVLAIAPRLGEAFALEALGLFDTAWAETEDVEVQADLLDKSLLLAAHFDQSALVQRLVAKYHEFLKKDQAEIARHGEALAGHCFRGLRKFGLRDEIEALLHELVEALTQGESPEKLCGRPGWPGLLGTLLHVADCWFFFGNDEEAVRLLEEARLLLYGNTLSREDTTRLACRYAGTLGQAPVDVALQGVEEMLDKLEGVYDNFTTRTHFSLSQLQVVEAIVLGIVTEDFAMGGAVRRWLDDDEYLVRRRIHHDMQAFLLKE
jgi:hypothetical protein